uniref:Uncharacterized protein n=1 Tax=Avena sativa TaxID=4498 RepID=A0ACD5X3N9_AVESA
MDRREYYTSTSLPSELFLILAVLGSQSWAIGRRCFKSELLSEYISSVIPIGAMFAMTLWLGNSAYLYISVAFAQMLKAIMPVAVFLLGTAFGLEEMNCKMLAIMSVISVGVIVASVGEITISWVGVVYQMGGVVAEALRLIFIEIFLKKKGVRLNLISMMYYVSPCSAFCLFIPWLFLEKPKMDASVSWNFPPVTLFLNCMCTFVLNLSVFLVISRTSALTARVTGVVRDWSVVLLSAAIFADTKLTFINIVGYAIALAFAMSWPALHGYILFFLLIDRKTGNFIHSFLPTNRQEDWKFCKMMCKKIHVHIYISIY